MMISAADRGSLMRARLGFGDRPATGRRWPPGGRTLVGARGFEPPTSRSRTVRATRLRYAPTRPAYCTQAGSRLPRVLSDEFDELALAALARLHLPTDLLDQRQHLVHGVADRHHHSPALGELLEERRWHRGAAGGDRIRSNGASSGHPSVPLPTRTHTFVWPSCSRRARARSARRGSRSTEHTRRASSASTAVW